MWALRGLMALAALAALIVLILIVHEARKPKFRAMRLCVREGVSLYDSAIYDLPPTKKAIPMIYVVESAMAAKFGIPDITLQQLVMMPIRSVDGTIKVANRKPVGAVQVTLEGNPVGKHAVRWSPGQTLELHATPGATDFLRVVLTNGQGTLDPNGGFGTFGGGDFGDNFGVPDGFDIQSANNIGGSPAQGFNANNGADPFDLGAPSAPSNPGDSDF